MPSIGFFGAHAVVGGNLTIAAGVALAQQELGTGAVTLCLFGDGACGSGALHETLNLAGLWNLPLVLVCSNNGYAVSTPVLQGLAPRKLSDLARPFGIRARDVEGWEVDQVAEAVGEAVAEARAGRGPSFLEVKCARLATHSTLTKEERPAAEMERLAQLDPIVVQERRLRADGLLDDAMAASMQAEIDAQVAEAERFADLAAWPDGAEAVAHV
jgi:pyruvate dehydrogenase E1 component alpha subunit